MIEYSDNNKIVLTESAFGTLFTMDAINPIEHEELLECKCRLKMIVEHVRNEKYSIDKATILRLAGEEVQEDG
jgi:hypothetical protein